MPEARNIGILTSGGDCSGLNSIIRAAARRASVLGYEALGVRRGVTGLLAAEPDYIKLNIENCGEEMLTTSGSILYSDAKSMTSGALANMSKDEFRARLIAGYKSLALDGLIYIGGDGSISMLQELLSSDAASDINIVVVPKTIDNDVAYTDFSVGFLTAVEAVCDSVENIRSTARSHERTMVVEVMGRNAGFIAMCAGVAAGADAILVPEFEFDMAELKERITKSYACGKDHFIILVGEAVQSAGFEHDREVVDGIVNYTMVKYKGVGAHIADVLNKEGIEARATVLGHLQRGGKTSVPDRIIGSVSGIEAVNAIHAGEAGCMLAYVGGKIKKIQIKDLGDCVNRRLGKSDMCVRAAVDLEIYVGNVS